MPCATSLQSPCSGMKTSLHHVLTYLVQYQVWHGLRNWLLRTKMTADLTVQIASTGICRTLAWRQTRTSDGKDTSSTNSNGIFRNGYHCNVSANIPWRRRIRTSQDVPHAHSDSVLDTICHAFRQCLLFLSMTTTCVETHFSIWHSTMKTAALFVTSLAAVSAFAPTPMGRSSTQINESLFDKVNDCRVHHDEFSFTSISGWP